MKLGREVSRHNELANWRNTHRFESVMATKWLLLTISETEPGLWDRLLYDTMKLEARFQECVAEGDAYKLAGAGKGFISYLMCVKDHDLFAVWNSNAELAFRKLGVPTQSLRKGPLGLSYLDLLEASTVVRSRLGLADFRAVDEFSFNIIGSGRRKSK